MHNLLGVTVGSCPYLKETHVAFTYAHITKTEVKSRKLHTKITNPFSLHFFKVSSASK
jgi:hypothetical protein